MERFSAKRLAPLAAIAVIAYLLPYVLSPAALPEATRLVVVAGTAMSLNVLVGATGLISMGQGLFLGLGAYIVALGTLRYGMSYGHAALLALAVSVPMSLLVGLISLRTRHLFFGLLTMAIGQVAFVLVARNYELTGGDDGLVGVTVPHWLDSGVAQHWYAVTITIVVCIGLLKLLASPFGAMLSAVRDNSDRVASLGGNPKLYELAAFVIAGTAGSVFGIVYAGTQPTVEPGLLSWITSAMLLMMVALGGRSLFLGPMLGALILEVSRAYIQAHSSNSDLVVGAIVILCAVLFPEGVGPPMKRLLERYRSRRSGGQGPAMYDKAGSQQ